MPHILCSVSTKGRTDTTLASCLSAVAAQTRPPDEFLLIDDNPQTSWQPLENHPVISQMMKLLASRIKKVASCEGMRRGPQHSHNIARETATELVWRLDDDHIPDPTALAVLEQPFLEKDAATLGASCGRVHGAHGHANPHASSSARLLRCRNNLQFHLWPKGFVSNDVGHIHGTYLYRKRCEGFEPTLSPVGHREETRHTLRMKASGWRMVFLADAFALHLKHPTGGIRMGTSTEMWTSDEKSFEAWLAGLPFDCLLPVDFVARQGLGDAIAMREAMDSALPLFDPSRFERRVFAVKRFLPLFADMKDKVEFVLDEALYGDFEHRHPWNAYGHMGASKHRGGLASGYLSFYKHLLEEAK